MPYKVTGLGAVGKSFRIGGEDYRLVYPSTYVSEMLDQFYGAAFTLIDVFARALCRGY